MLPLWSSLSCTPFLSVNLLLDFKAGFRSILLLLARLPFNLSFLLPLSEQQWTLQMSLPLRDSLWSFWKSTCVPAFNKRHLQQNYFTRWFCKSKTYFCSWSLHTNIQVKAFNVEAQCEVGSFWRWRLLSWGCTVERWLRPSSPTEQVLMVFISAGAFHHGDIFSVHVWVFPERCASLNTFHINQQL